MKPLISEMNEARFRSFVLNITRTRSLKKKKKSIKKYEEDKVKQRSEYIPSRIFVLS